ncbi:MAG: phosphoglycerate kinase, partial [Streptosporangiaceae bacterium]
MAKLSVQRLHLADQRVLARVDYNVPLNGDAVGDDSRLLATLPTLRYMREHRARVVLCAHLGRPQGRPDPRYSLRPVAERLSRLTGHNVGFCPDAVGTRASEMASRLEAGGLLLLENLRFYPGEEANDASFARQLAELGEAYVDDAFGVAHRAHAST